MKLLRTYTCKSKYECAQWIEIPYADKAVDLWDTEKLEVCNQYLEYTTETVVPIGFNPFKK